MKKLILFTGKLIKKCQQYVKILASPIAGCSFKTANFSNIQHTIKMSQQNEIFSTWYASIKYLTYLRFITMMNRILFLKRSNTLQV